MLKDQLNKRGTDVKTDGLRERNTDPKKYGNMNVPLTFYHYFFMAQQTFKRNSKKMGPLITRFAAKKGLAHLGSKNLTDSADSPLKTCPLSRSNLTLQRARKFWDLRVWVIKGGLPLKALARKRGSTVVISLND